MNLERYGWTDFFQRQAGNLRRVRAGRVRLATARRVQVYAADPPRLNLSVPRNVGPAVVGDWVLFDPKRRIARRVLARRNALARNRPGQAARRQVLASNIDAALIVCGLDRRVNQRQVERYLTCVLESGAEALIVLNKSDISDFPGKAVEALQAANPRFSVALASAVTGDGLQDIRERLPAQGTVALAGPSGVGKSSLVNALLDRDHLQVGSVRASDRRGRHTTTRRELVIHPEGWLFMDLPGIRELYPWSTPETVDRVFGEIGDLSADCYYRDCRHRTEPRCAVRSACEAGEIDAGRLASYLELREEQETLARNIDQLRS